MEEITPLEWYRIFEYDGPYDPPGDAVFMHKGKAYMGFALFSIMDNRFIIQPVTDIDGNYYKAPKGWRERID